jgi:hypothetical protein
MAPAAVVVVLVASVAVLVGTVVTLAVVVRVDRAARAAARRTEDRLRRIGAATAELGDELDRLHRDMAMLVALTERVGRPAPAGGQSAESRR